MRADNTGLCVSAKMKGKPEAVSVEEGGCRSSRGAGVNFVIYISILVKCSALQRKYKIMHNKDRAK